MGWVRSNVEMCGVINRKILLKHLVNENMKNRKMKSCSLNVPCVSDSFSIQPSGISEGKLSNPTGFHYCLSMAWPSEPGSRTPVVFLPWQKHTKILI